MASYWGALIRESLDCISSSYDVHERHARNLTDAAAELAIARCHNVAPVGCHPMHEAVVGVGARM